MNDITSRMVLMGAEAVVFAVAVIVALQELRVLMEFSSCLLKGSGIGL